MRRLVFSTIISTVIAAATLISGEAAAQQPWFALTPPWWPAHLPWCALNSTSSNLECRFDTWAQCSAFVSGVGGYCMPNPYAAPKVAEPHKRVKHAHRY
jgi:hypothetical protein